MLAFNFNIFLIIILIGILIIGYTTGFIKEIKKILNIFLPLIVIFFWGRKITTWIYNTSQFQYLKDKLHIVDISYYNTLIMLALVIIIFSLCYFSTKIIINLIDKRLYLEVVKYKIGKVSNYLGFLFSFLRFYLIASILLIPFFMFGFTTTNDFTTYILTNYSVPFTQISKVSSEIEPVVSVTNSLKNLLEVIDINYLKSENKLLNGLKAKLDEFEEMIKDNYNYSPTNKVYPYLFAYISDDDKEDYSEIISYKGLIIWVNEENIDLNTIEYEILLNSFINNYEKIVANTSDEEVKSLLYDSMNLSKQYLEVNKWLKSTLGDNYHKDNLYNDKNTEKIMIQLVEENQFVNEGLFYQLSQLNISKIEEKLINIKSFIEDYDKIYKNKLNNFKINTSFIHKIIALVLNEANYLQTFENSPLFSTFIIDTFKKWDDENYTIIYNESIYQTLIKVIIPLYYLKDDILTENKMNKIVVKLDDMLNRNIITDDFFLDIMYALVNNETQKSYLSYLKEKNYISIEGIKTLNDYFNKRFLNSKDERVIYIGKSLRIEGEIDG